MQVSNIVSNQERILVKDRREGELMTIQIRTVVGNSRKGEVNQVLRRYQNSGNDGIVQMQTCRCVQAQIIRKHRDVTREHECLNMTKCGTG